VRIPKIQLGAPKGNPKRMTAMRYQGKKPLEFENLGNEFSGLERPHFANKCAIKL
jgi:hypothetical protein